MSQPADRSLPPLPLTECEPAKITLHRWTQIVGTASGYDTSDLTSSRCPASTVLEDLVG